MQDLFRRKYQSVFRAVVLMSVLTGLLFSGGEGIRLFPFPPAEILRGATSKCNHGDETGYQKNAHRFEKSQANYQTKFQRENPPHQSGSAGRRPDYFAYFAVAFCVRMAKFATGAQILKSRFFDAALKDRAPPAIF